MNELLLMIFRLMAEIMDSSYAKGIESHFNSCLTNKKNFNWNLWAGNSLCSTLNLEVLYVMVSTFEKGEKTEVIIKIGGVQRKLHFAGLSAKETIEFIRFYWGVSVPVNEWAHTISPRKGKKGVSFKVYYWEGGVVKTSSNGGCLFTGTGVAASVPCFKVLSFQSFGFGSVESEELNSLGGIYAPNPAEFNSLNGEKLLNALEEGAVGIRNGGTPLSLIPLIGGVKTERSKIERTRFSGILSMIYDGEERTFGNYSALKGEAGASLWRIIYSLNGYQAVQNGKFGKVHLSDSQLASAREAFQISLAKAKKKKRF